MTPRRYKPTPKLVFVGQLFLTLSAVIGMIFGISYIAGLYFGTIYEAEWWQIFIVGAISGLYVFTILVASTETVKRLP